MRMCAGGRLAMAWLFLVWLASGVAFAQPAAAPLTINDAVQLALKNYPSIRASRAAAQAAQEGVGVARTAYLPRLDFVWQENLATSNNVFGLLLPQSIVPPISGPVLPNRSYSGVWGSAAGVLLSWEALDFGQRKAAVAVAEAETARATAQARLTELDVAAAAADAYLTVLAADEGVRAARANVSRMEVLTTSVRTLVRNELRPGADQSRAEAELAIARNQLSQAVQAAAIARAALAEAIGAAGTRIELTPGKLVSLPDVSVGVSGAGIAELKSHPAAQAQAANIDAVRARERGLGSAYYPRVSVQSALAGRGSGAEIPGQPLAGSGAWLQVPNWAIGASLTFPAFDVFSINARKRVEAQHAAVEAARYDQTLQSLTTQTTKAGALLEAALEIARNTPIARQAAGEAESRARVRYENGLAPLTDVADAQHLLAQADTDEAIARLSVWRALLALAQARGDLSPMLTRARQP